MASTKEGLNTPVYRMPSVSSVLSQEDTIIDPRFNTNAYSYRDLIKTDSNFIVFIKSFSSVVLSVFLTSLLLIAPIAVATGLVLSTLNSSGVSALHNQNIPSDGVQYSQTKDVGERGVRQLNR